MRRLLVLLACLLPLHAHAEQLKIATWNLDWLTTRHAGDRRLPRDVVPRAPQDFARLAGYAQVLNADVIAIQEVDGFRAASLVFPRDRYSIHMTHDHVIQRVGLVVRRGLHYTVNPDFKALHQRYLRSGADITLHLAGSDLRILAVHLKEGCRAGRIGRARSHACRELSRQVGPLADWIAAREHEGVPFVVLGDFNRWLDHDHGFMAALDRSGPLASATSGRRSPCWGGEDFIDHIFAGDAAARWMRPDTMQVLVYRETDPAWKDRLSDHCPLSVDFNVP